MFRTMTVGAFPCSDSRLVSFIFCLLQACGIYLETKAEVDVVYQHQIPTEVCKNIGDVCGIFPSHSPITYAFPASSNLWTMDE